MNDTKLTGAVVSSGKLRFEVRPQRKSERFPYTIGFAVWDRLDKTQTGWFLHEQRASDSAKERNREMES